MKQKIVLGISILVGLLAFWLTTRYLKTERERLYAGAEKIKILAASRDLAAGAVLRYDDLGKKSVYKSAVGENVFKLDDLNRVLDRKLRFSLKRGEPLWWSHVEVSEHEREGLAPMIKSGLRAISIAVGGEAAVSGLVQPNDRVDILGTFTFPSKTVPGEMESITLTVLQDVTILATGQQLAKDSIFQPEQRTRRAGGYNMVTVEVTPREAELLVFAQHVKGNLTLSLRNPSDVSYESDLPDIDFGQLQHSLPELNLFRQQHIRHKK